MGGAPGWRRRAGAARVRDPAGLEPRAGGRGRRAVPGGGGRPLRRAQRPGAGPARAALGAAPRDLGRRPQPGRGRLLMLALLARAAASAITSPRSSPTRTRTPMLAGSSPAVAGDQLIATASESVARGLSPPRRSVDGPGRYFAHVETRASPRRGTRARARTLAGPGQGRCSSPVRSTCLRSFRAMPKTRTISGARERISVLAFACFLLLVFVGLAFAAGWIVGRELL